MPIESLIPDADAAYTTGAAASPTLKAVFVDVGQVARDAQAHDFQALAGDASPLASDVLDAVPGTIAASTAAGKVVRDAAADAKAGGAAAAVADARTVAIHLGTRILLAQMEQKIGAIAHDTRAELHSLFSAIVGSTAAVLGTL